MTGQLHLLLSSPPGTSSSVQGSRSEVEAIAETEEGRPLLDIKGEGQTGEPSQLLAM